MPKNAAMHYEGEELGATLQQVAEQYVELRRLGRRRRQGHRRRHRHVDDYGWDNAFDSLGRWTRGPLHGYVYLLENTGRGYVNRGKVEAAGALIDVYGRLIRVSPISTATAIRT